MMGILTKEELEFFRNGAPFEDLVAISRQEWAKRYRARKARLYRLLRRGKITREQYATRVREAAQECGV
jgi:hypothetical protein